MAVRRLMICSARRMRDVYKRQAQYTALGGGQIDLRQLSGADTQCIHTGAHTGQNGAAPHGSLFVQSNHRGGGVKGNDHARMRIGCQNFYSAADQFARCV